MMKRAFFFLLLTASLLSSISSSEARDKISSCIRDTNPDLPQSLQPIGIGSDYFWTFNYPISSQKKIIVAINDGSGERVIDEVILHEVATTVFRQGIAEEIKSRGYSANLLQTTIAQTAEQTRRQQSNLEVFREQTEKKYQQLSLQDLQDQLNRLSNQADDLDSALRDSLGYQQAFETDYSQTTLNALLGSYNASFDALALFIQSYDDYQKSISDLESEVYKSSIPDPDNKNIYSNLENLRDLGLGQLYAKAKASDPRLITKKFEAIGENWVKDSVESYFFIDTRCNAEEQFAALDSDYRSMLQSESLLKSKGLGPEVESVKQKYTEITALRSQRSLAGYKAMLEKMPEAKGAIDFLKDRFEGSKATIAPQQKQEDYTGLVIIGLIIAIAAYAFMKYKSQGNDPL